MELLLDLCSPGKEMHATKWLTKTGSALPSCPLCHYDYVAMCQVIFEGPCIISSMVPDRAAEIPRLLISTNDSGVQDHTSLLAAYKELN